MDEHEHENENEYEVRWMFPCYVSIGLALEIACICDWSKFRPLLYKNQAHKIVTSINLIKI
jgi:hypothetical protein